MNVLNRTTGALAILLTCAFGTALGKPPGQPVSAVPAHTRLPTAQEVATFQAYYQGEFGSEPQAPQWNILRNRPGAPWTVEVSVDSAPERALRNLCRRERRTFSFERRWSAGARSRQFVWLQAGVCSAHPHAIELLQRMPDVEVMALLGVQAAALPKARLIMAGNSECAALRSFRFAFAALDIGRAGSTAEEMAGLVYRADTGAQVTVWVRRNGSALDNWGVSCPPRPGVPTVAAPTQP